ncbi:YebC/PmpR family DNA-binding transcriptional regulator [bacterium]|nr:YebC/PmpR family DNA-binding transcriptional regulator [bacterium]
MSGHSKWSTIKRKKGAADAKRGAIFGKMIKEITVAARMGGGDIGGNPRLRRSVEKARAISVPNDNIERAIKKGTGELEGVNYEEITYEGYGPSGVAVLVACLTDNKVRTVAEVRNIFSKKGGNMGDSGCVGWMFGKKGIFIYDKGNLTEDALMEAALDAGAEDIKDTGDNFEVTCDPTQFEAVLKNLEDKKLKPASAEIAMLPQNTVNIAEKETAQKILALIEALEDNEDVQNVYANFDIPAEILNSIA